MLGQLGVLEKQVYRSTRRKNTRLAKQACKVSCVRHVRFSYDIQLLFSLSGFPANWAREVGSIQKAK